MLETICHSTCSKTFLLIRHTAYCNKKYLNPTALSSSNLIRYRNHNSNMVLLTNQNIVGLIELHLRLLHFFGVCQFKFDRQLRKIFLPKKEHIITRIVYRKNWLLTAWSACLWFQIVIEWRMFSKSVIFECIVHALGTSAFPLMSYVIFKRKRQVLEIYTLLYKFESNYSRQNTSKFEIIYITIRI